MEYYPEEINGGRSFAAQRPAEMFGNATGFGIDRSHFINVEGGMHIHPIVPNSLAPERHLHRATPTVGVTAPPQEVDDVYSENEMYCSQLLARQRGYPLYVPGPQRNLPQEYRTNGVAIGDVGMVTPEGIWDFFFNIFLPADDPINGNNVPNGFSPLEPYHPADVLHLDFEAGTYVCSSSVHGYYPEVNFEDFPGGDFHFNCRGPKGALLALPHGSHLEKLRNQEQMRQYAMENAESWYRYINCTRGRRMANGELYLITGCEKSLAGGMATFQHVSAGNDFNVVFKPFPDAIWPSNIDLTERDTHALNNTIFLHGFTISLGEGLWGNLFGRAGICQTLDSPFREAPSGYIPFGSQGSIFSYSLNFLTGGGGTAGKHYSASGGEQVTISELSRTPKIVHPSRIINDLVLRKVPHTTLVITHDDDWRDIFRHDGTVLNTSDLIQHFFEMKEENGAAYLVAKSGSSPLSQNLNGNAMPDLPDIVTTQVARELEALYASEPIPPASVPHPAVILTSEPSAYLVPVLPLDSVSQARRPTPPRTNVIGGSDIDVIASAANSLSLSSENEPDESSYIKLLRVQDYHAQPSPSLQRPTCTGIRVRSPADAHVIFHAVALGVLPMITRRLDTEERRAISSGCVFVWEERGRLNAEMGLGIDRWTDSRRWGPSRNREQFILYHERPPDSSSFRIDSDLWLRDSAQLIKQTYTVFVETTHGRRKWHLVAYFTQDSVDYLQIVDDIPHLADIRVPPGIYRNDRYLMPPPKGIRKHVEEYRRRESAPVRRESAPVRRKTAPVHADVERAENDDVPGPRESPQSGELEVVF